MNEKGCKWNPPLYPKDLCTKNLTFFSIQDFKRDMNDTVFLTLLKIWISGFSWKIFQTFSPPWKIWVRYTPFRNERDNLFHYFSLMKSSKNCAYFFTCILPDFVTHESSKVFWKNSHFENIRAAFLQRCQNTLRQTIPWNHAFSAMKKNISTNIMC